MITRNDLDQARDLLTEIARKSERLAVMHSRLTGKAITYHEKVQESATDFQEFVLACMADMETEIEEDKRELQRLQERIVEWAKTLPLPEKQVIMMRYIACLEWAEIADNMAYSLRQVFRFHGDAVRRLSDAGKDNS